MVLGHLFWDQEELFSEKKTTSKISWHFFFKRDIEQDWNWLEVVRFDGPCTFKNFCQLSLKISMEFKSFETKTLKHIKLKWELKDKRRNSRTQNPHVTVPLYLKWARYFDNCDIGTVPLKQRREMSLYHPRHQTRTPHHSWCHPIR